MSAVGIHGNLNRPVLLAEVVLDLRDELIGTTVNSNNQSCGESTRGMLFTRSNSCDV